MTAAHGRFTVVLEREAFVTTRWAPNIVLHDSDGELLTEELRAAFPDSRVHLLMLLNGMTSISQDALAYFAKHAPLAAVGLVGPSVLDQALIELYMELYQPPFPVGYFEHEAPARSWLARQPGPGAT